MHASVTRVDDLALALSAIINVWTVSWVVSRRAGLLLVLLAAAFVLGNSLDALCGAMLSVPRTDRNSAATDAG